MVRALALVTLLAGCNQIFDLEVGETSDAPGDGSMDDDPGDAASDEVVVVDYVYRYARNPAGSAEAAPKPVLVDHDFAGESRDLQVTLDDGTHPMVMVTPMGVTFHRASAAQGYLVTVTDLGESLTYQHHAANLTIVKRAAGRRVAAGRTETSLYVTRSGAGSVYTATTGQWTHSGTVPDPNFPVRSFTPWHEASPTGETILGELQASEGDCAYSLLVNRISNATNPYDRVTHAGARLVTTGQGMVELKAPDPLTPDNCTTIETSNATAYGRLVAATPRDLASIGALDWRVVAVPFAQDLGPVGETWVAYRSGGVVDDVDAITYARPIAGHDYIAEGRVAEEHFLQLGQTATATLESSLRRWNLFTPDPTSPPCTRATLDSKVPLPTAFSVAGVPLETDADTVPVPAAGLVAVDFEMSDDAFDQVGVTVYAVSTRAGTAGMETFVAPLVSVLADEPPVMVPASTFIADQHYVLVVASVRGLPMARAGDLGPVAYPHEIAFIWSRMFRAVAN